MSKESEAKILPPEEARVEKEVSDIEKMSSEKMVEELVCQQVEKAKS